MKLFPLSQANMKLKEQLQQNLVKKLKRFRKMEKSNNSRKLSKQKNKHLMIQTVRVMMKIIRK
jgi:hypothetical protein